VPSVPDAIHSCVFLNYAFKTPIVPLKFGTAVCTGTLAAPNYGAESHDIS
jgi:hypothetical protein